MDKIFYDTNWLIEEVGQREHVLALLREISRDFDVRGGVVIELGSGIGTNLSVFNGSNSVLGVEGMGAAVEEALRRGIDTIRANLEGSIPLQSGTADLVLLIDVLEHLVDPEGCLQEACRLVRPGGLVAVNVPNHFDWRGRIRLLRGSGIDTQLYFPNSAVWRYPHLRFFQRGSIEDLMRVCRLEVVMDYSDRLHTFPGRRFLGGWAERYLRRVARRWPDVFSSGFFLVCRLDA